MGRNLCSCVLDICTALQSNWFGTFSKYHKCFTCITTLEVETEDIFYARTRFLHMQDDFKT